MHVDQGLPGPRPRDDDDLGLLPKAKRKCHHAELAIQAETAEANYLTSTAEAVIKGDTQKADNASVPDHLWVRAFVLGYGGGIGSAYAHHMAALGLTSARGTDALGVVGPGEDGQAG